MKPRPVYPLGPWLFWALGLPLAGMVLGTTLVATVNVDTLLFDHPRLWWIGACVPLAGLIVVASVYRKRAMLSRFASGALSPLLARSVSPGKQALRRGLLVLAVMFISAGIVGPRWGIYLSKVKVRGVDVVVAVDVSRSMLAGDMPPNRLTVAKERVRQQLTERTVFRRANRFGLLAFAGSASLRLPLTTDALAFRVKLDALDTSSALRGGTAIAQAIRRASDMFARSPEEATKVLLVVTDGDDHEGDPTAEAQLAWEEHGIHIYTVGAGVANSTAGARVPESPGSGKPLLHDGQIVFSKLDVETLKKVATVAHGQYVPLEQLHQLVDAIADMHQSELSTEDRIRHTPRYQWFVLVALLLLAMETLTGESRPVSETAPVRLWQQEGAA